MKRLSGKFQPNALLANSQEESQPKQENDNASKQASHKPRRRRKSIGALGPRNSMSETKDGSNEQGSGFMNQQLTSMYSRVIQMSTENKINTKNTWGLNFIDHMDKIVESQREADDGQLNFQKASCALDASVKIYSYRVDDTWTTSYRVLENLNRTDKKDDDDDDGTDKKKPTRQKSKADSKIEQNMNNITLKKFDTEFEVDPLFHKMSQMFDKGGAQGMLLNNLSVSNGCELVFDSIDIPDTDGSDETEDICDGTANSAHFVNCSSLLTQLAKNPKIQSNDYHISKMSLPDSISQLYSMLENTVQGCTYNEKSYGKESDKKESGDESSESGQQQQTDVSDISRNLSLLTSDDHSPSETFGTSREEVTSLEEQDENAPWGENGSDSPGQNQPPSFSAADENFGGDEIPDDDDSGSVVSELMNVVGNGGDNAPVERGTGAEQREISTSDYQYFDEQVMDNLKIWAGPHHWKCNKNRLVTKKSQSTKSTKKAKKASEQYLDFSLAEDFDISLLAAPKRSAGTTMMSQKEKTEQSKESSNKFILPDDMQMSTENFAHLFLMQDQSLTVPIRVDGSVSDNGSLRTLQRAEENNKNGSHAAMEESMDFGEDDDDFDDAAGDFDMGGDVWSGNAENDTSVSLQMEGQELLTAARKVDKIQVNYEKSAKRIDVQKLKGRLWNCVEENGKHENGGEGKKELSFQSAVSSAAKDMPSSITPPIYFICMLHLANEHNLDLEQTRGDNVDGLDISDFSIVRNE